MVIVKKFKANKVEKLSCAILNKFPMLGYNMVQKLLRNKDVKVNEKRVGSDMMLEVDDEVVFYAPERLLNTQLEVIYQDDNIVIVYKNRNLETISESGEHDLKKLVELQLGQKVFAVHRLDRNTEGLVVFAKNLQAKAELDMAFKNRTIEKFYVALVFGILKNKSDKLVAYLKKDATKSCVVVLDEKKPGFAKIQTNYKVIQELENSSIIEVELVTGKTHQIRAHFAHIGHFVVGDEKYGDAKINKLFKKKQQCLCAYKIKFHFDKGVLQYLNNKEVNLDLKNIDFCKNS